MTLHHMRANDTPCGFPAGMATSTTNASMVLSSAGALKAPLDGLGMRWPYLWLDATYLKVRDGGRVVSIAAIIATAVNQDGRREIIGLGLGPSEAATFWLGFLRDLHKRGLTGVGRA
jgi:hypothetical protein